MGHFHLIAHDVVVGEYPVESIAQELGWSYSRIGGDVRLSSGVLADLERQVEGSGGRPLVFGSLPVARRILRFHPGLVPGVFLDAERLQWNYYASHLRSEWLLNPTGVLLPFSHLPGSVFSIQRLFGDHVFIRPNSPLKPFTGVDLPVSKIPEEIRALEATEHVAADELCLVAPRVELPSTEYRFWLIDGEVSPAAPRGAPYSWKDQTDSLEAPEELVQLARLVARETEASLGPVTCDLVMTDDGPRIVECNGISTSGFYPGMDPQALFLDLARQFA